MNPPFEFEAAAREHQLDTVANFRVWQAEHQSRSGRLLSNLTGS